MLSLAMLIIITSGFLSGELDVNSQSSTSAFDVGSNIHAFMFVPTGTFWKVNVPMFAVVALPLCNAISLQLVWISGIYTSTHTLKSFFYQLNNKIDLSHT